MKTKFSILLLCSLFGLQIHAQNSKTHTLGVQLNPYAKSSSDYGFVANLRYMKTYKQRFSWGVELFENTYDNPSYSNYLAGLSLLMRVNVINRPKISYFVEGAVYSGVGNWTFKKFDSKYEHNFPYYHTSGFYASLLNYYIAPGIQIPFANHKFSIDIMLKASQNPVLFDSWKLAPTYRLNFHF